MIQEKGGAVSLPGGKLVDVTVAVFGPDDDLVGSDELPSSPDLVVVTGHRAEQRVVTCIEDLTETHIFNHFAVGSGKTKQKILSAFLLLSGKASSYPPVLGADNQQAALSEGTEGNTLTALTVDRFGLLFKHRIQVLKTHHIHKSKPELIPIFKTEEIDNDQLVFIVIYF